MRTKTTLEIGANLRTSPFWNGPNKTTRTRRPSREQLSRIRRPIPNSKPTQIVTKTKSPKDLNNTLRFNNILLIFFYYNDIYEIFFDNTFLYTLFFSISLFDKRSEYLELFDLKQLF